MKIIIGMSVVVLLLTLLNVDLTLAAWDQPLPPKEYQKIIGQGFSVSLFTGKFNEEYKKAMINDMYQAGFRNLRIRCSADLEGDITNPTMFQIFLDNLATVVDDCLYYNVIPIISYNHYRYLTNTTIEGAKENYIGWWREVAKKLNNKDYRLGFNLITEISNKGCRDLYNGDCSNGLKDNNDTYNEWTKAVVAAIRKTGGNSKERIIILASPRLTGEGLTLIDESIYENDTNLMVEFHTYASGPSKKVFKDGTINYRYWEGNGTEEQRSYVHRAIQFGINYTATTGVLSYFGAWMPYDNKKGSLNMSEAINFGRFFVQTLGEKGFPWTLNQLFIYYDIETCTWAKGPRNNKGTTLYPNEILEQIKEAMIPYTPYYKAT